MLPVSGSAGLLVGDEPERAMSSGDYMTIAAGTRRRMAWTDAEQPTVRLTVHLGD